MTVVGLSALPPALPSLAAALAAVPASLDYWTQVVRIPLLTHRILEPHSASTSPDSDLLSRTKRKSPRLAAQQPHNPRPHSFGPRVAKVKGPL
jgi:hypothetical protein